MREIDLSTVLDDRVFALVYGASGTGKTHLMGTLGELGRVLIIDIDQGVKTLRSSKRLEKYRDNLTAVSFDVFKDLDTAAQLVYKNDPDAWNKALGIKENPITEPFDWVVWDTWSELQWYMLEELRSKDPSLKGNGLDFRKNVQIQHWGMMTDLNKLAIQELRKCKVSQVFTMQEVLIKDELSGQIYDGPAIHGKLVQEMPAFFDVVIRTYSNVQGAYCATNKAKGRWPGKTRLAEGVDIQDPTAKQLLV